ncbi:hypothetical protein HK405_008578 [Cladochytrium tenue]|nr:hypothetical protein HK405_008578 [Cladochytrium tenue]
MAEPDELPDCCLREISVPAYRGTPLLHDGGHDCDEVEISTKISVATQSPPRLRNSGAWNAKCIPPSDVMPIKAVTAKTSLSRNTHSKKPPASDELIARKRKLSRPDPTVSTKRAKTTEANPLDARFAVPAATKSASSKSQARTNQQQPKARRVDTASNSTSGGGRGRGRGPHRYRHLGRLCTQVNATTGEWCLACPAPWCKKSYRHANGLRYHLDHAHANGIGIPRSLYCGPPRSPSEDGESNSAALAVGG